MKQIETKEEVEKKSNRNKFILGAILVVLMIFSTAGYALFQSEKTSTKKITYNNVQFLYGDDGYWHFSMEGQDFLTQSNPQETSNISSSITASLAAYSGKNLYFSYDSDRYATQEIVGNIGRFASRIQYVCLDDSCTEDLPVKNCSENVIIIKESNQTLIRQENNCIYILSSLENSIKAGDKFIFSLLKI